MNNSIVYIFGAPGSGKTFLSDEKERKFLLNTGTESIPVNNTNLDEIIPRLNQFKNTILVVQSNGLSKDHIRAFKTFVENKEFNRMVIVQSEFEPDSEIGKLCQVYETGYPYFSWVTQIAEDLWMAKAAKSEKTATAHTKIHACEFVRDYTSGADGVIYAERI